MSDLVERLVNRSENSRVFHSDRTLFAEAAEAITTLRTELAEQARLNGMGAEREARLMAEIEELKREKARLVAALSPFASYLEPGMDRDDKDEPLPDTHGVGWVYLTIGDFRRAAAAIRELTADKEGA